MIFFINRRIFSKKISLLSKKKLLNFRSFEIIFSNLYENYLDNKSEALKNIENALYKNRFIDETSKRNNFGINDDDIVIKDGKKKLAVIISQQVSRKLFYYQLFCQIAIYTKITIRNLLCCLMKYHRILTNQI